MNTLPTENTEELRRFIVQEIAVMVAKGIKTGVFEDFTVANKIADEVARREHQAVQAFVEKVLKEKKIVSERPADGSMEAFSILAVPVSVITSLMNKETRR